MSQSGSLLLLELRVIEMVHIYDYQLSVADSYNILIDCLRSGAGRDYAPAPPSAELELMACIV